MNAPTPTTPTPPSLPRRVATTPMRDWLRGQLTGRLDLRALVRGSDLPGALQGLVLDVARRTRLWRPEKIDVARELIAHFRDGLAAGASADELAANFGDPATAARLIRRATKRKRPLAWRAAARAAQALGLLIVSVVAIYGVLALRYFTGTPVLTRNETARFNAGVEQTPREQRAWPLYIKARAALGPDKNLLIQEKNEQGQQELKVFDVRPGHALWPIAAGRLRGLAGVLDLARTAAAMPTLGMPLLADLEPEFMAAQRRPGDDPPGPEASGFDPAFGPPDNPPLYMTLLPNLGEARLFTRLLSADTHLALEERDAVRAEANITAMLGLAGQCREFPSIISDLVAQAILALACQDIGRILELHPSLLGTPHLAGLAHRLGSFAGGGALRVRLEGERLMFEDLLQRSFTDDGAGDGRLTPRGARILAMLGSGFRQGHFMYEPLWRDAAGPAGMAFLAGRRAQHEEYTRLIDLAQREIDTPPWLRGHAFEAELSARSDASSLWNARYLFVSMFLPAIRKAGETADRTTQIRDACTTAIALELFRRRDGEYPGDLARLVPGFLPAVPADIYDGRPLRYRLENGVPLLYSIGSDYEDNGGVPPSGDDTGTAAMRWRSRQDAATLSQELRGDWVLYPPSRQENGL